MNLDDGTLTLHQSDISHYITCPEQFRLVNVINGPIEDWEKTDEHRVETDAASVGTNLHSVIEHDLDDPFTTLGEAIEWAESDFGQMIARYIKDDVQYRTESFGGDPDKTLRAVRNLVESWYTSTEREYWLGRNPKTYRLEHEFNVPFVTRTSDRIHTVRLAGTMDVLDTQNNRVVDWKSASREYQRWEKQRWAHQATVYTFAGVEEGLIVPNGDGLIQFDFKVFVRGSKPVEAQTVTVWRGPGQWGWLTQLVNNIADMIESDASVWPLRDDHALCGPKWCPMWDSCKGAFVTEDWT